MSQLFLASTFFGAMNLAAAIDDGTFDTCGRRRHRVLLASTNSRVPEASTPLTEMPGFDAVASRFDAVADWNAVTAPFRPPDLDNFGEPSVTSRWLAALLGLDDEPVELVLESIQVKPARAIADLFVAAPVTIYSDGLMSYGPTRVSLPHSLGCRIDRLVHLDLLPGVRPVLLREFGVEHVTISDAAFRSILSETAAGRPDVDALAGALDRAGVTALVLGQYLAALDLMTEAEEDEMYADMIRDLAAAGHRSIGFKPHPTSPSTGARLRAAAATAGVELHLVEGPVAVEHLFHGWRPEVVVGCFSTGLFVAERFFDLPIARRSTREMLTRLEPFPNSNRIPLVLCDAVVPPLDPGAPNGVGGALLPLRAGVDEVQAVVDCVAYAMQPALHDDRRDVVVGHLEVLDPALRARYLDTATLTRLDLPGARPSRQRRLKLRARARVEAFRARARRHPRLARSYRRVRTTVRPVAERAYRRNRYLRKLNRIVKR